MVEPNTPGRELLQDAVARAIQQTLEREECDRAKTHVLNARENEECDITNSVTILLPECFGEGDIEAASNAFLNVFLATAEAFVAVVNEAERITESAAL